MSRFERSAVAEHAWKDGRIIEWDQAEILDMATDECQRQVKEAIYIKMTPPGIRINQDEGLDLTLLWLCAIHKLNKPRYSKQERNTQMPRPGCMLQPNPQLLHSPATEDQHPTSGCRR